MNHKIAILLLSLTYTLHGLESQTFQSEEGSVIAYHLGLKMFNLKVDGLPQSSEIGFSIQEFIKNENGEFEKTPDQGSSTWFSKDEFPKSTQISIIFDEDGSTTLRALKSTTQFKIEKEILEKYNLSYPDGRIRGNHIVLMDICKNDKRRTDSWKDTISYIALVIESN